MRRRAARIALLLLLLPLAACATPQGPSPVLADNVTVPRADLYVFNVSSPTMIPLRRYVSIDGHHLVRLWREEWRRIVITPGMHEIEMNGQRTVLDAEDGRAYYIAVGLRPRRAWLLPVGAHPVFVRQIPEAHALRLFTEMKAAE